MQDQEVDPVAELAMRQATAKPVPTQGQVRARILRAAARAYTPQINLLAPRPVVTKPTAAQVRAQVQAKRMAVAKAHELAEARGRAARNKHLLESTARTRRPCCTAPNLCYRHGRAVADLGNK